VPAVRQRNRSPSPLHNHRPQNPHDKDCAREKRVARCNTA
jgi:hypothetical protein